MKKISVIIPCYNAERYLHPCINSILGQSIGLASMECIFVNDASTDGTLSLLMEMEKIHPDQIMVINLEENMRQGTARNIALQYATGEYISFVDADDWIEPDMYEILYEKAKLFDCDMVGGLVIREGIKGSYKMSNHLRTGECITIGTDRRLRMDLILNGNNGGICSKLFKREMTLRNELVFPERMSYEDNYWLPMACLYINRYYIEDRCVYHYREHQNSTVNSRKRKDMEDRLAIEVMKLSGYAKKGFLKDYFVEIEALFCRSYYVDTLVSLLDVWGEIPIDLYETMRKTVLDFFPHFEENSMLLPKDLWLLSSVMEQKTNEQLEKMVRDYR